MAVLILGSNEIGPVNEIEMIFVILTLICSAMLNAIIFGDIAGLIAVLSKKESNRQNGLDEANSVMQSIELEEGPQEEVREFLQKTLNTREKQTEFNTFFEIISPSLVTEVQNFLYYETLTINPVIFRVCKLLQQNENRGNLINWRI